jgi:hypothetical protein
VIKLKEFFKFIIPSGFIFYFKRTILLCKNLDAIYFYSKSSKDINRNKQIDVLFFVIHHSVWKLDTVYKKFDDDARFNPVIIICPYIMFGEKSMIDTMNVSSRFFKQKKMNVIESYENGIWLNINKKFTNKIIFFTNPHNITMNEYRWPEFRKTLCFYVPYHHQIESGQWDSQWNSPFHSAMSKLFYIAPFHKLLAKQKMLNKGRNVVVTGYPATENLQGNDKFISEVWKKQDSDKLKVIFSPHHTIEYSKGLGVCEFLNIADKMKDISIRLKEQVQFSFKPHPILKQKLIEHPLWGVDKVEEYYQYWQESDNTQIDEGEYNELFLTSDVMVHDSGSFLAEYLYVNKPVMYLYNITTKTRFNDYGLRCLDCCYFEVNNDVEKFLLDIISNKDDKLEVREKFINDTLRNKSNTLPSLNIFNEVCSKVFEK